MQPIGGLYLAYVEPSPNMAKSESPLSLWDMFTSPRWLRETPPRPMCKLPMGTSMLGNKPLSMLSAGGNFDDNQQATALALQETFSVVSNQPRPRLQNLLNKSWGSMGPRWTAAGLGMIWDYCEWPQSQHWHQIWISISLVKSTCFTLPTPWDPTWPKLQIAGGIFVAGHLALSLSPPPKKRYNLIKGNHVIGKCLQHLSYLDVTTYQDSFETSYLELTFGSFWRI